MGDNFIRLVNKNNPIEKITSQLVQVPFASENVKLHPIVVENLKRLLKKTGGENEVIILDGYRSEKIQEELWNNSMIENGDEITHKFVAPPNCSEHQTGLAFDIGLRGFKHDKIRPTFNQGKVVEKFRSEMTNFGFILRYPKEKEMITGIAYEPWHFRYVGLPHSQIITKQNWVLEEYIEYIQSIESIYYGK